LQSYTKQQFSADFKQIFAIRKVWKRK